MKLFLISMLFSLLSLQTNGNYLQPKSLKNNEEKTNQNYLMDGVEVHDSSELSTINFQNQKLIVENEGNEYNIVSKNLNTGVLNFIDFDEDYYYYRQYAFDTAETKSNLKNLEKSNYVQENNIQIISNNEGKSFLYTEGYTPNYESSNKVALVAYSGDYHWYRQEADGYWSHKRGHYHVERVDYSNNLIIDPYTADRGNYTNFLGYFAVSPWGNMYERI